uniref:Alginate lyase 2 domain-containing protein n=1 Tax=Phaseolus vulgaris TaxID=3885 RepID=V7AZP0_PHAVU|nr:hypothetical protein PHAVU_009G146800g [Phaseolus vulgaris]ESW09676.1 hypothetical protein PHAVU_009G146800g [Phaseolus vulgaris]
MVSLPIFHQTLLPLLITITTLSLVASDPTDGFTPLSFSNSNIQIQTPYDVPQNQRYSYSNGVHRFWVYSTDKPHTSSSQTAPRSEMRITGYDYSSGVWQFEGHFSVPSGVYGGSLTHYQSATLEQNIYNKWYRFNVIHDVGANNVKIFINGVKKFDGNGRGAGNHYFKCGVYAQNGASNYMESRWRDIKIFRKY